MDRLTVQKSPPPRRIWLTFEAAEIIELKQLVMDHDVVGARAFFRRAVVPRVRKAAEQRGIAIEGEGNDDLPG